MLWRMLGGREFSLARVGPYDYFPESYDQNYKFLILQKGGRINQSVHLKYTIYDEGGNVRITKNE